MRHRSNPDVSWTWLQRLRSYGSFEEVTAGHRHGLVRSCLSACGSAWYPSFCDLDGKADFNYSGYAVNTVNAAIK